MCWCTPNIRTPWCENCKNYFVSLIEEDKIEGNDYGSKKMTEKFAEQCHDSWSGWMKYLFDKSEKNKDGSITIPKELVFRWQYQMHTEYSMLPEEMKESDRMEALRYFAIHREWLQKRIAEGTLIDTEREGLKTKGQNNERNNRTQQGNVIERH